MNQFSTLLERYWICKDVEKEQYYQVKRDIPLFQKFVRELLGWKLIHTEHLIKIEKIPAHAESFMGIQEFSDIRDYCILCVVLMFLEDKPEQERFLLSELIQFVETCLKQYMEIDWTSFTQRKSLVRVLQYMEKLEMLRAYDGSSEGFEAEASQEVLYENTGYSRYFATSFPADISQFTSWKDFETVGFDELAEDRGTVRTNRVYRQLVTCPSYIWEEGNDPDALYLKNQRQWVARHIHENLGGRLDIHRNAAFWMLETEDRFGREHPRNAMLPEIVLLVCAEIRSRLEQGEFSTNGNECIDISFGEFEKLVLSCREKWKEAWSKEYREMDECRLLHHVREYMADWMMLRCKEEGYELLPTAGKMTAVYPKDYNGEKR